MNCTNRQARNQETRLLLHIIVVIHIFIAGFVFTAGESCVGSLARIDPIVVLVRNLEARIPSRHVRATQTVALSKRLLGMGLMFRDLVLVTCSHQFFGE
jgi:hypothetical protein